jgi:hypothetical protein
MAGRLGWELVGARACDCDRRDRTGCRRLPPPAGPCHPPRAAGGGFLTDHFPAATKAVWHFDGIYCTSRHIPGAPRTSHHPAWRLPAHQPASHALCPRHSF